MNDCFVPLNLKIFPLAHDVSEYLKEWPNDSQNKIYDISFLNPELILFFQNLKINLRETFIFWSWDTKKHRYPHTDGNWFPDEKIVAKRQCGINWNFTPNSWVEFYKFPDSLPEIKRFNDWDFASFWKDATEIIAVWGGSENPIIFNPQIPHMVRSHESVHRRTSITLRFHESYETLNEKLQDYKK